MSVELTVDELLEQLKVDDLKRRMAALGFPDHELQVSARAAHDAAAGEMLRVVEPQVNFSIPMPQTVLELRTFERALHFKYLKSEEGQVVGNIYSFAESRDAPPVGLIKVEVATPIIESAKMLIAAIKELPANRPVDDPHWDNDDYVELIQMSEMFRLAKENFGGIEHFLPASKGGRPTGGKNGIDYDRGFALLKLGTCNSDQEAFIRVIAEIEDIPERNYLMTDTDAYAEAFEKFRGAMRYRRSSKSKKNLP